MSKVKRWPISYLVREIGPPSSKSGGNLPDSISDTGTLDREKKLCNEGKLASLVKILMSFRCQYEFDVPALAWPESPGFDLVLGGSG